MDAAEWDRRYSGREMLWSAEPNEFVASETRDLDPGRALDVGCGEGRNAIWLAERGWQVVAVDFSRVALQRAERLAAERRVEVEWIEADLIEFEPVAPFDLVLYAYVHLAPSARRAVLQRASASLGGGGLLLVVGHDLDNLTGGIGGPPVPDILLTADAVSAELDGMEIDRAEQVTRDAEVEGEQGTAIDTLVTARKPL